MDVIADFAYPLPGRRVLRDVRRARRETSPGSASGRATVARNLDPVMSAEERADCMQGHDDMHAYLERPDRGEAPPAGRRHPHALVHAEEDGDRLSRDELVAQVVTLYVAGPRADDVADRQRACSRCSATRPDGAAPRPARPAGRRRARVPALRRAQPVRAPHRHRGRCASATGPSRPGRCCSCASARPTVTPSSGVTDAGDSTCGSSGPPAPSTCSSARASTSASVPTWPASRPSSALGAAASTADGDHRARRCAGVEPAHGHPRPPAPPGLLRRGVAAGDGRPCRRA